MGTLLLVGYAVVILSAFLITWIILPFFIRRMHARGIIGKDMNKTTKPDVAEMGGAMVMLGFVISIMVGIFLHSHMSVFPSLNLLPLLAALLTIV